MKTTKPHWTASSIKDFVYRVSSDFVLQIENRMGTENISQRELAERVELSEGRVSQIMNNPGNLTLRNMVEFALRIGMKLAVVAYDDADPENINGPINSQIFQICWERSGRPTDFFEVSESTQVMSYIRVVSGPIEWGSEGKYWMDNQPQYLRLNIGEVGEYPSSNDDKQIYVPPGQVAATENELRVQ